MPDWVIPRDECHLRRLLTEWVAHYNRGRRQAALGPGLPDDAMGIPVTVSGHQLPRACRVTVRPILGVSTTSTALRRWPREFLRITPVDWDDYLG